MNIIEKEAKLFYDKDFLNSDMNHILSNIKSSLSNKLDDFNFDRHKLDFLKILRQKAIEDKIQHEKNCSKTNCGYEEARDLAIFAIDQEMESINEYYTFEPDKQQKFNAKEESDLHDKLNKILDDFEKQGYGQQIIFEEIEELKNHFNLGEKNWFQLLKGKLFDLAIKKVLDETVVKAIYNQLSKGYEDVVKMIGV